MAKFGGKHLCWSLFFIRLQDWRSLKNLWEQLPLEHPCLLLNFSLPWAEWYPSHPAAEIIFSLREYGAWMHFKSEQKKYVFLRLFAVKSLVRACSVNYREWLPLATLCGVHSDSKEITAWKVSVFGVILVRIFPHSDLIQRDTQYRSKFSPYAGKYKPEQLQIRSLFTQCILNVQPSLRSRISRICRHDFEKALVRWQVDYIAHRLFLSFKQPN